MAGGTPGSQRALREANQHRVLSSVRTAGALTQAEIARETGLSPATVSNIVKVLRSAGVVMVRPTSSGGRRAVSVSLAGGEGLVAGLDIGAGHLRAVVSDHTDRILAEERIPYDLAQPAERGLRRAEWLVVTLLRQARTDRSRVRGLGVSVAAPLGRDGRIIAGGLLPWDGVDVAAELRHRLKIPVHAVNDANAGAMGELMRGAGRGMKDFAYLRVAEGVGCGLILDGRLYEGPGGIAGEIGHVTVDERGSICHCGNRGCLHTVVGAPYLLGLLPDAPPTLGALVDAAVGGDLGPRRVVADAGRAIGAAAATVCNLLNPPLLIVGGDLSGAGDLLMDPMRDALGRHTLPGAALGTEIRGAGLGTAAEVMGAVAIAKERSAPARALLG